MWRGTRRLILLNIPSNPAKFAQGKLSNQAEAGAVPQPARQRPGALRGLRDAPPRTG